jgi:hypothetical protein
MPPDVMPLSQAAVVLGVSSQLLRNCIRAKRGPGLAVHQKAGRQAVSLEEARAYLDLHTRALRGKKNGDHLHHHHHCKKPADPFSNVKDLKDVVHQLVTDPSLIEHVSADRIRALTQIETLLVRREEYETKKARLIPMDEVLGMLRSLAEVMRDEVDSAGAARAAREVSTWLRSMGLNLSERGPGRLAELENIIRASANDTLAAIGERLQEQSSGVQLLGEAL